jgi:hypothetical protein
VRAWLSALLLLAASPAAAGDRGGGLQPRAVPLSRLKDASDDELVALFFGPLRTFPYVGYRSRDWMTAIDVMAMLRFYGPARATDRAGVCGTDELSITLRRTGGGSLGDPLMQPVAFDLQPIFIIENRHEADRPINPTKRSLGEREAACLALDPRRNGIPADYPYQLMTALELVEALGTGARAGHAAFPIDCRLMNGNGPPPPDDAACLRELARLYDVSVRWVKTCQPQREAPGGCIQVMTDSWWIEFDMNLNQTPRRAVMTGIEDHRAII